MFSSKKTKFWKGLNLGTIIRENEKMSLREIGSNGGSASLYYGGKPDPVIGGFPGSNTVVGVKGGLQRSSPGGGPNTRRSDEKPAVQVSQVQPRNAAPAIPSPMSANVYPPVSSSESNYPTKDIVMEESQVQSPFGTRESLATYGSSRYAVSNSLQGGLSLPNMFPSGGDSTTAVGGGERCDKYRAGNDGDARYMTDLIVRTVQSSLEEGLITIKNNVQNIHIDLIKQMAAQNSLLGEMAESLPHAFNRLTEENRLLKEENDRLKAKLYMK